MIGNRSTGGQTDRTQKKGGETFPFGEGEKEKQGREGGGQIVELDREEGPVLLQLRRQA